MTAARPSACSSRTAEIDPERSLHAVLAGEGDDIVLLHGAIATHQDWLAGPFQDLARLGRVVAVDRPGHGRSRRPRFETGPRAQAAQIRAGLGAWGVKRPILVAHSFGCRTAMAYAEQFPDEVAHLILIAPAAFPELRPLEHSMLAPRAYPLAGPAWARLMGTSFDRPMLEMMHRLMFAPQSAPGPWKESYPWDSVLAPAQSVAQGEEFIEFHPFGPSDAIEFGKIATPTHILAGTGDLILDDLRQARPLARTLPNVRLTLLKGVGHMLHHSASDVLTGAVEQALPGTPLRPLAG